MTIYSAPKGAEVFANNKRLGKTPLSLNVIFGSNFKLRLKLAGYQDWEKALSVTRDEELKMEMAAKAKSSSRTWLWVAGGVGAVAMGASAYILTSSGQAKTESLPPFQWPPEGKYTCSGLKLESWRGALCRSNLS
ncbi:MAG: PEGA domain-containing protein [candidate division KSB1 bacterium]|nr:PEGA domain-containing protein [candidate division KSB1 bacterium]